MKGGKREEQGEQEREALNGRVFVFGRSSGKAASAAKLSRFSSRFFHAP
jgi:hypothetical protein